MKSVYSNKEVKVLINVGKKYKLSGEKVVLKSFISSTKPSSNNRLYSELSINSVIKSTKAKIKKGICFLSTFSSHHSLELGYPLDEMDDLIGKVVNINRGKDYLEYTVNLFENSISKFRAYKKPRVDHPVLGTCLKNTNLVNKVEKVSPVVALHSTKWFKG